MCGTGLPEPDFKEEDKEQVAPARTAEFDAALSLYASLFPEQYATECDTPGIGCDIDNIIVYIDSNGNQIEERHHSY